MNVERTDLAEDRDRDRDRDKWLVVRTFSLAEELFGS